MNDDASRINVEPGVLGYWAARHGFTYGDLLRSKNAGSLPLFAVEDREAFHDGSKQYEDERRAERWEDLLDDLEAAYDTEKRSRPRALLEGPQ